MLAKTIENAHKGPVYDLWSNETTVFSGGKDGVLTRWKISVKLGSVDLQYLKSNDISEFAGGATAIKSVGYRESPPAIAVGTSSNQVVEINDFKGETSCVVVGHSGGQSAKNLNQALSLHPTNPDLLLSGGADGIVILWDLNKRKTIGQKPMTMDSINGHPTPIVSIQYSCSGDAFAVGLANGHIFINFGAEINPELTAPDKQPKCSIQTMKFSPNDQYLAAGLENQKVCIYDMVGSSCILLAALKGHTAPVTELDW